MRYDTESCTVEISAQELCLIALRSGDLDASPLNVAPIDDDGRLYYRLQAEAGAYYNPQMELSNTVSKNGIYYTVSTFADGVIRKPEGAVVDKLKSVKGRGYLAPPDEITLALLKCSAYFLCVREDLPFVRGRITYVGDGENKKFKYFYYNFARMELAAFFESLLDKIEWRARLSVLRATEELPSAENAVFPYGELREGQEWMIRESFGAMKHGTRLFVEAPTGTGKTISALYPAIKAIGRGLCDKVFYLTPKTATRREAFAAAAKLHAGGALTRTVIITAKEQICPCTALGVGNRNACSSACCEYSRGYYDRVGNALREMLEGYRGYSRGLISEMAKKHRVCPYELSLDLSELCDVIICDYNYAFDPSVYFRRYFGNDRRGKYVFLIDEAHNLADRAREMYSASLRCSDFEKIIPEIAADELTFKEIGKLIDPVVSAMRSLKKLCKDTIVRDENGNERGFYMSSTPIERVNSALDTFKKKCDLWLYKNENSPIYELLAPLSACVRRFLTVSEYFDSNFRVYAEIADGDITLKIYCLDPSDILDSLLCRASASVMFSATLTPPDYFRDVLGGKKNAQTLTLPSPFCPENLCVAVADYVNTRFDEREDNAKRFSTVIAASVTSRPGNYIAYFPSYQCLEQTYKAFSKKYPNVETVVQKKHMNAAQREEFLSAFKNDVGHLRIGFCVLGGVFSEGVDLPGSRLIGAIIFGVGLPGLSNEKNIIREYFDMRSDEGIGYDYAYTFPGMNNVLQAAGRVIRTGDDAGVVVLADDRYATPKYRALFPQHWQGVQYAGNASSLAEIIRRFWEKQS